MKVPPSILQDLIEHRAPTHVYPVLYYLYEHSRYVRPTRYRIVLTRIHVLTQNTPLSYRTVRRSLKYLRRHRYILLIWRGRPKPNAPKYFQSAYQLPVNMKHVVVWRIKYSSRRRPTPSLPFS